MKTNGVPFVLVLQVWFTELALHALVSWFNTVFGSAFTPHCSVVWTVGWLWNLTSDDGEKPINFLHHGHGPGCKRPTQGLYLCSVVDLGREMPVSPCSLAHRGCSVSDEYSIMMPDTVSPAADFSVQALLVCEVFSGILMHERAWVCLFKSEAF